MEGLFVQGAEDISQVDPDNRKKCRRDARTPVCYSFSFSFINVTVRAVPLDIHSCFSFLEEMIGIEAFFLDSCNGLILFGHQRDYSCPLDGYIMCNPTTRQWSAMLAYDSDEMLSQTYLAFDPAVSSHFHLVLFQMPDVHEEIVSLHVYSSKTGTWSENQIYEQKEEGQLEDWHHQFTLDCIKPWCAFVNGFLHLGVWTLDESDVRHILAVDIQGKARRVITVPGMADGRDEDTYVCYLGESQGHLHCMTKDLADEKNIKLDTWVLQDYDTQEWVLKNTVNSLDVFGETGSLPEFLVVYINQDCVFFFHKLSYELIAYNMDRKEVSVIATFEDDKELSDFARYIPYYSDSPALTNKY